MSHELELVEFADRRRYMLNQEDVAELLGIPRALASFLMAEKRIKSFEIPLNGESLQLTTAKEVRDFINNVT